MCIFHCNKPLVASNILLLNFFSIFKIMTIVRHIKVLVVILFSGVQIHMHFKEDLIITLISYLKDLINSKRLLLRKKKQRKCYWKIFWKWEWCFFKSNSHFYCAAVQQSKTKLDNWPPAGIYNTSYPSRLPLIVSSYDFTDEILYSTCFEISLFQCLTVPGPHQNFRLSFVKAFQVWKNKNQLIAKFYLNGSSCELLMHVSKMLIINIIHTFIQYQFITLFQLSYKFPGHWTEGMMEQNLTQKI